MRKVSSADFKKHTGQYQDMALMGPIAITKHNRPTYVLLSFEEYQKLSGHSRRALPVSELSDEDLAALAKAKVPAKYARVDEELED